MTTLKRKRSSQEDMSPAMSSSSISRCSTSPTPTRRPAHPDYAVTPMDVEGNNTNYAQRRFQPDKEEGNWLAGALNSRTRKRFRDNRPDEESMHSNTIQKLFAAQRQHPNASPILSQTSSLFAPQPSQPQKSTLHSFWQLPSAPSQTRTFAQYPTVTSQRPNTNACDDCDRVITTESNAMDIDGRVSSPNSESACTQCQKKICDFCAVATDMGRRCLDCT